MRQIIEESAVMLDFKAEDWKEAITQAGELMVAEGIVERRYIDAMISLVEGYGAYIIVAPGVAMPHARAEDGAKGTGICFLRLKEPVVFPQQDNNPIRILVGVAAANKAEHLETFGMVAEKIVDPECIKKLTLCATAAEVVRIFQN